ncbi:MAG: AMP-binding protein [Phycisphaerales bacterium]|nr:AMP-binding protein [Phycisphaerae bacterium]NNF43857.1 AMP-binding protein [Phycisphaerales bacterium]NNM26321.1 AMP-binding protein [Phycisphaerales bacterium]
MSTFSPPARAVASAVRPDHLLTPAGSYDCGPADPPLLGLTIGQCLDRTARAFPDADAVIDLPQRRRHTYRGFNRIVNRAAKAFLRLGIAAGDRVAIWSTNNDEWVVAQFATAKIGAILVNINPAYRSHELEYVLKHSRARVLILIASYKSSNYLQMLDEVCPEVKQSEPGRIGSWRFPDLETVVFIGSEEHPGMLTERAFAELGDDLPDAALEERRRRLDPDDEVNIQYTSGTTGFPKGVVLTHHNILNNALAVACAMKLTADDRVCVPVPFYHCFGMVLANLAAVTAGAAIVIPSGSFDAAATLAAVAGERCTVLHGVPTMFQALLDDPARSTTDMTTLRTGVMGGAPSAPSLVRDIAAQLHVPELLIAYGQTEASPVVTLTRTDDSIERRVSTVGCVLPHQEIKVVDVETGLTVPRGADGELCVRGYQVMRRYDGQPDATAEAIDGRGWLHTGDVGVMEDDGSVRITGRLKDMVIRGGENIYPREIEEFIGGFEPVSAVAVVGVPDPKYGEELCACVQLGPGSIQPTPEEFRGWCREKIAHFKIPRYWLVLETFPMTVTGKVQKFTLRENAIRVLGLAESSQPPVMT